LNVALFLTGHRRGAYRLLNILDPICGSILQERRAAGKKRIAAAARARWAKFRAAKKKAA
jgi:hypothetical protein